MHPLDLLCRGHRFRSELKARRRRLYRLAYSWCFDPALADDLAQEALAKGYKNLHQLRCLDAMDGWLCDILANCWRDYLRRRRPSENIDDFLECTDLSFQDAEERAEIVARVRAAIERLPLGQRQVLWLVEIQGCSYEEVARSLQIPTGTVTSRIVRAREALRQLLDEYAPAERNVVPWRKLR